MLTRRDHYLSHAKAMSVTFNSAVRSIDRERRRQNAKYAAKQIVRYTAKKSYAVRSVVVSGIRAVLGIFGSNVVKNNNDEIKEFFKELFA